MRWFRAIVATSRAKARAVEKNHACQEGCYMKRPGALFFCPVEYPQASELMFSILRSQEIFTHNVSSNDESAGKRALITEGSSEWFAIAEAMPGKRCAYCPSRPAPDV